MKLIKVNSAGPNSNPSFLGIFADAALIVQSGMIDRFRAYLKLLGVKEVSPFIRNNKEMAKTFISQLLEASELAHVANSERLGKLSPKLEAAGKIRVFAIVDSWTQSLLKPLHQVLFKILRTIPNDGTFDQDTSVHRIKTKVTEQSLKKVFSFDLSAATDRLPISLQSKILDTLIGIPGLGEVWRQILVDRDYVLLRNKGLGIDPQTVRYAVGQPMGALSSWAMLAITHH